MQYYPFPENDHWYDVEPGFSAIKQKHLKCEQKSCGFVLCETGGFILCETSSFIWGYDDTCGFILVPDLEFMYSRP